MIQTQEAIVLLRSIARLLGKRHPISRVTICSPDFNTGSIGHELHKASDQALLEVAGNLIEILRSSWEDSIVNTNVISTGFLDLNKIPIFVGDLIRIKRDTEKDSWVYKKVLIINDKFQLVSLLELGLKPTTECHKSLLEQADSSKIEVIDGQSCYHPILEHLITWHERKELPHEYLIPMAMGKFIQSLHSFRHQ